MRALSTDGSTTSSPVPERIRPAFAATAQRRHALKLFERFRTLCINDDAPLDRAELLTLRRIVKPHAFSAAAGTNLIVLRTKKYRLIRALGFADVAVDALVGNDQRHGFIFLVSKYIFIRQPARFIENFFSSSCLVRGETNFETSPPMDAISRTKLPLTN